MNKDTTFSNNLINSSIFYLLNFEKYTDFQQAAKEAAINNNFQIVLFSDDFNVLFSVETRHETTIEQAVLSTFNQNIDRDQKGALVDVGGLSTYWGPVNIAGKKYYLMLVDNDKYYSPEDITKLAEIIELAMGMWNYVPIRDPQTEFLRALKKGNKDLAHSLSAEAKVNSQNINSVFLISGIKNKDTRKLFAKFVSDHNMDTLVNIEHDEIWGIILESDDYKEVTTEEWETFGENLHRECGTQKVFWVNCLSSIEDACAAFRVIAESDAFVRIIFPCRHVFGKFEMVFVNSCVQISRNGGALKKENMALLRPLAAGRDTKSKQLFETLTTFVLDAGMSASKTAEIMGLHANTVQYRLKHIKEKLGVEISSGTMLPALMGSLAVARIDKEAGPF